jgi:hypothetical protein
MAEPDLERTRRSLHAVAELVLAGPQYRAARKIELRVSPGGFSTVVPPERSVVGTDVVAGGTAVPISGTTVASLAAAVGVTPSALDDVYSEGCDVPSDEPLGVDAAAALRLSAAWELGDAALRLVAPDEEPVLWPEHFDVGIRVDDINYGVSPGDGYLGEPYAYVGVDPVPVDAFWNAPFGRACPMTDFADVAALRDFFHDGRTRFVSYRDQASGVGPVR